jgi:histidinol-phosphate aminotransferase
MDRADNPGIPPVTHGGIDYAWLRKRGASPEDVRDFSVCVNPFPLPESVRTAATSASLDRYPDSLGTVLREALGKELDIDPESILITNGTSQGISLLPRNFIGPGDRVLVWGPCYGEYEAASRQAGARVSFVHDGEADRFRRNSAGLLEGMRSGRPGILWLCNPNNPTGKMLPPEEIIGLARACAEIECVFVVDEAYMQFTEGGFGNSPAHELLTVGRTVILRSMTKDYGIPGLRLGYAAARREIIESVRRNQPPWSLNAPALEAGAALLKEKDYFNGTWRDLRALRAGLAEELSGIGLEVFESRTNFFLCKHPDMDELIRLLRERCILLRDCASFGLPGFCRIGVRLPDENRLLVEEAEGILRNIEKERKV